MTEIVKCRTWFYPGSLYGGYPHSMPKVDVGQRSTASTYEYSPAAFYPDEVSGEFVYEIPR